MAGLDPRFGFAGMGFWPVDVTAPADGREPLRGASPIGPAPAAAIVALPWRTVATEETGMLMRLAAVLFLAAGAAQAAAMTRQTIDGSVPIYCRDNEDKYRPIVHTSYGEVQQAFRREFGWRHGLFGTSASLGLLVFSQDGEPTDPETISYDVEPHDDGIALLHMHVRLVGKREDLSGTSMCWRTFAIVKHHPEP